MKGCDAILEDLPAYAAGKLTASERSAVDAHVRGCDGCMSELRSMERLEALLLGLPKLEPSPDLRSRFANRLAAEIDAEAARSERGGVFRWLMRPWLIPALATPAVALWVLTSAPGNGDGNPGPQTVANLAPERVQEKVVAVVDHEEKPRAVAMAKPHEPREPVSIVEAQADGLPAELENKAELFVDFDVIRELEQLEGKGESAG